MHAAHDHGTARGDEVTKVSSLPRRFAKLNALTELAANIADVPRGNPQGGFYSWAEPYPGRIELHVHAGDRAFTRGVRVLPTASSYERSHAQDWLIDRLFDDLVEELAKPTSGIVKRFDKPMSWRDRLANVGTLLFIAGFILVTGGKRSEKDGAK